MIALTDKFNQVSLHNPSEEIIKIYRHVAEINELDNRGFPICRPLFSHSSLPSVLGLKEVERTKFDFKSKFSEFDFDTKFTYFVHVHHN